jgi:hypothetical protein
VAEIFIGMINKVVSYHQPLRSVGIPGNDNQEPTSHAAALLPQPLTVPYPVWQHRSNPTNYSRSSSYPAPSRADIQTIPSSKQKRQNANRCADRQQRDRYITIIKPEQPKKQNNTTERE